MAQNFTEVVDIMIPLLYEADEVTFNHNGLGLLMDTLSCTVTEELNGLFELELTYPVDGIHADEIEVDRIIRAEPRENASVLEPFRIYRISRAISGQITVYAQHITYQMTLIPVMPIMYATRSANAALQSIAEMAVGTSPWDSSHLTTIYASPCTFNFFGWEGEQHEFGLKEPTSLRSVLGGIEGSFLDVFGGEITWSYPNITIQQSRGTESGLVIEYGRNMLDLVDDDSLAGVITGICPFARSTVEGTETIVTLTEKIVESQYASAFPYKRTVCVDLSDKFTDNGGQAITEAQLRAAAQEYVAANAVDAPKFSIEVSFIGAKQDLGYTLLNANNVPSLGDTVTVKFSALGLVTTEKVTKTVYDVLLERYNSVTVGRPVQDLATTIANVAYGNDVLI